MALAVLAVASGCGRVSFDAQGGPTDGAIDTPPAPPDLGFNPYGHWTVEGVHVVGGGDLRNDDLVNGFRGDLWFETNGTYRSRAMPLQGSQPTGVDLAGGPIQYGAAEYILVIPGSITAVYATTVSDADHVHAVWKPADPRNSGTPAYDVFDIARTPDLPAALVGTQMASRFAFEGIPEFAAGSCVVDSTSSDRVTGTVTVDQNFILTATVTFKAYAGNTTCSGAAANRTSVATSFMDATDTQFTLWTNVDDRTYVRMVGDLAISPQTIRFMRTDCALDLAECANDVTVLELAR